MLALAHAVIALTLVGVVALIAMIVVLIREP